MSRRSSPARAAEQRRRSARAVPLSAALTVAAAALVYAFPVWWAWTLLLAAAVSLLGDAWNGGYFTERTPRAR